VNAGLRFILLATIRCFQYAIYDGTDIEVLIE